MIIRLVVFLALCTAFVVADDPSTSLPGVHDLSTWVFPLYQGIALDHH